MACCLVQETIFSVPYKRSVQAGCVLLATGKAQPVSVISVWYFIGIADIAWIFYWLFARFKLNPFFCLLIYVI